MIKTRNDMWAQGVRELHQTRDEPQQEISINDARQATPLGHVRYVLGISLALVVVLFAIIYFSYSHTW